MTAILFWTAVLGILEWLSHGLGFATFCVIAILFGGSPEAVR